MFQNPNLSNKISIKELYNCYSGWFDENLKNSKYDNKLTIVAFSKMMRKKYWKNKDYKAIRIDGKQVKGFELL